MVHLPSHNRRLSPAELSRAKEICEQIQTLFRDRASYVRTHNVPEDFAYTGGNWVEDGVNDFMAGYRRISRCDHSDIQHLRLFSQVFSGCSLLRMHPHLTVGARSDADLPADLDAAAAVAISDHGSAWEGRWRELIAHLPRGLVFDPPHRLGEMGLEIEGVIVNHDTCAYQERINLLYESGVFDWLDRRLEKTGRLNLLEIGGGYGALATFFKRRFPEASYTIIDLPGSLVFSTLYLGLTRPDLPLSFESAAPFGWRFVPNYAARELTGSFDLAINTISFSEMPAALVRMYGELLKNSWLVGGGILFEQNADHTKVGWSCAQAVLATVFPHHTSITSTRTTITQGAPNLWSSLPIGARAKSDMDSPSEDYRTLPA